MAVACGLDVLICARHLDTVEQVALPDPASDVRMLEDGTLACVPAGRRPRGRETRGCEKRPDVRLRQHRSDGRRGRRELR